MATPVIELTRREEFSASHRLHNPELSAEENRRVFGPCNNPNGHGHNYALEVTVRGPIPGRTGMLVDLNRLAAIVHEQVLSRVDHRHLDLDVPFLRGTISTAENLAVAFWDQLAERLEAEGCRLHRIRLEESRNNHVEYYGPGVDR